MKVDYEKFLLLKNIHPNCKLIAEKTLNLAYYSNNKDYNKRMENNCLYCGDLLFCNNKLKNHNFKKINLQECIDKKLPTGKCINNYICIECGYISTVDSSD